MSLKFVPKGTIDSNIGSHNGLVLNRQQAIIWANADPIYWCIYAAVVGDKLMELQLRVTRILS